MRKTLTVFAILVLTSACSQAPVQTAATQVAAACPPPAAAPAAPPPVAPTPPRPAYPTEPVPVQQVPADKDHRLVKIETNLGDMVVQLDATRAPLTVKNFLAYVEERYFDNSGFYRVVPGFVIQGGDFTPDLKYHQPKHPAIPNESGNGLSNLRGAIGMGTEAYPHSAQAAFYIDLVDNRKLDPRPDRWGYAVFGQVVQGLDVVDKIAAVSTHTVTLQNKDHDVFNDVPVEPVKILKVTLLPLPAPGSP
jgi:peptidyl-prolyl cis-trans isomerase A (cyclophilin A)